MAKIPVEEGKKEYKNKWKWRVLIKQLHTYRENGETYVVGSSLIPEVVKTTTGATNQEVELIDNLVNDRRLGAFGDSILYKALKNYPDGKYQLVIEKQTNSSRIYNKEVYAFWGHCVVSKNKDVILWETRYFQSGETRPWDLETRDPREDARRKNYKDIPSGGIDLNW